MLRTLAVARLLMPKVNIQAPPNLNAPYYEELLDAGINDWGGISPLTPDYINPEKPGRIWSNCGCAPKARDSSCASACRSIRNSCQRLHRRPGLLSEKLKALATAKVLPEKRRAA